MAKKGTRIFIGHGHSQEWEKLRRFVKNKLDLKTDEFNRVSPAGKTPKRRLKDMLNEASFAFLRVLDDDFMTRVRKFE